MLEFKRKNDENREPREVENTDQHPGRTARWECYCWHLLSKLDLQSASVCAVLPGESRSGLSFTLLKPPQGNGINLFTTKGHWILVRTFCCVRPASQSQPLSDQVSLHQGEDRSIALAFSFQEMGNRSQEFLPSKNSPWRDQGILGRRLSIRYLLGPASHPLSLTAFLCLGFGKLLCGLPGVSCRWHVAFSSPWTSFAACLGQLFRHHGDPLGLLPCTAGSQGSCGLSQWVTNQCFSL